MSTNEEQPVAERVKALEQCIEQLAKEINRQDREREALNAALLEAIRRMGNTASDEALALARLVAESLTAMQHRLDNPAQRDRVVTPGHNFMFRYYLKDSPQRQSQIKA